MAMTGMNAATGFIFEVGGDEFSHSWTIELEPGDAFAQLTVSDFWETDDEGSLMLGISALTHRKSNGQDKHIGFVFPSENVSTEDLTRIVGDRRMSSITVGAAVKNIFATWMLQVFFFD